MGESIIMKTSRLHKRVRKKCCSRFPMSVIGHSTILKQHDLGTGKGGTIYRAYIKLRMSRNSLPTLLVCVFVYLSVSPSLPL